MAIIRDRPSDVELYQVLAPAYFDALIEDAEAQKERLKRVTEILEPTDMLCANVEILSDHLDELIEDWRGDAQRAALRLS